MPAGGLAGWVSDASCTSLFVSHSKCSAAAQESRPRAGRSLPETTWHRAPNEGCRAEIRPRHRERRAELDVASPSWSSLCIVGEGGGHRPWGPSVTGGSRWQGRSALGPGTPRKASWRR